VFVEYVMLAGVNDSIEHAHGLVELLDRDMFKVNLIPYNPTGMYDGSSRDAISKFKHVLDKVTAAGDGAPDTRPRHRRRLRATRGGQRLRALDAASNRGV